MFGSKDKFTAFFDDMHRLDMRTKIWTAVKSTAEYKPVGRQNSSAVYHNGRIYLFGGGGNHVLDDFWMFEFETPDMGKWTQIEGEGPSARDGFLAGVLDNKLYVAFGWSGKEYLNDVHEFDIERGVWK